MGAVRAPAHLGELLCAQGQEGGRYRLPSPKLVCDSLDRAGRCREILDDLQEPKTVDVQAAVEATRNLLPRLDADLKASAGLGLADREVWLMR